MSRPELQEEVNEYLDLLRESGACNMFGAADYVAETFDVPQVDARDLLMTWMDTYAARHPS